MKRFPFLPVAAILLEQITHPAFAQSPPQPQQPPPNPAFLEEAINAVTAQREKAMTEAAGAEANLNLAEKYIQDLQKQLADEKKKTEELQKKLDVVQKQLDTNTKGLVVP